MRRLATIHQNHLIIRLFAVAIGFVTALGVVAAGGGEVAGAQQECGRGGCVSLVEVHGLVDDIVVEHVIEVIDEAEQSPTTRGVIIQIDSPGLVADNDRLLALKSALTDATTNTSIWVGPSGSGLTGGAAEMLEWVGDSGVANGATIVVERPMLNPTSPVEPAKYGRTLSAEAAQKAKVVDRVSPTIGDHLIGLDWIETKVVEREGVDRREPVTVARFISLPLGTEMLHTAASPAVAYLALTIGLGLLLFEFFTAGVGVAGVVGAASLLLAGYGLGALPVRTWALGLIVVAFVALAIDVQTAIPRFWTGAGLLMFSIGTIALFDGLPRPWFAMIVGILGMATVALSGMPSMVRARFGTPTIGRDWMVGQMGEAVTSVDPEGIVRIDGAMWRSRTHRLTPLAVGDAARVVAIDGLLLEVEPEEGGAVDYREMRSKKSPSADEVDQTASTS